MSRLSIRSLPLVAVATLVACASPQERCVMNATEDLRVVNALIDETEANIDRGYAIEEELEPRVGLNVCTGRRGSFAFCTGTDFDTRERPVALDLAEEERKLASLIEKRQELEVRARRDIAACEAAT
ncbi:MAG: hypothetical protein AAF771_00020 [Pseudomonadota bacterium]